MTRRSTEELDYYATIFKKIRNKKYEFFVISRIIHLLNDRELEFTTQQLIRTENNRFLLDLYFPQLKFAIEVDEDHHDRQVDKDKERDRAVVEKANVKTERIIISGKSFEDVSSRIEDVVCIIRQMKEELMIAKKIVPFVYGQKYETKFWLSKGTLSVSDDARFRTHVDVAKIFGKSLKGHQRALIKLDDSKSVWFPKLYENGDWNNQLTSDGKLIEMEKVTGGRFNSDGKLSPNTIYYVFAHYRDELGQVYYAFKGGFNVTKQEENKATFTRVCDAIEFSVVSQGANVTQ